MTHEIYVVLFVAAAVLLGSILLTYIPLKTLL